MKAENDSILNNLENISLNIDSAIQRENYERWEILSIRNNLEKLSKTVLLDKIIERSKSDTNIIKNSRWNQFINSIKHIENNDKYIIEDLIIDFIDNLIKINDEKSEMIIKYEQNRIYPNIRE